MTNRYTLNLNSLDIIPTQHCPFLCVVQSNKLPEDEEGVKKPKLFFFYGSQTGTAEDFSTQLEEDGTERGFECEVVLNCSADLKEQKLYTLAQHPIYFRFA